MSFVIPPRPHEKNRVVQQTLPHLYPHHTPIPVALTLVLIAVVLIPIGVATIVASDRVTEVKFRYDEVNNYRHVEGGPADYPYTFPFQGATLSSGARVRKKITLEKSLTAPIYIQYRLHNFYQNFRQYVTSIDTSQLLGNTGGLYDECEPYRFPGEAQKDEQPGYYSPCGLIPWSMFNDTFALYKVPDGTVVDEASATVPATAILICDGAAFSAEGKNLLPKNQCHKTGIALNSDATVRFKPAKEIPKYSGPMWMAGGDPTSADPFLQHGYYYAEPGHPIPLSTDEDLMVWARLAYLGEFAKMYRIIDVDLPAGDYFFDVVERFPVSQFEGRKYFQLVTRNWIGGRNHVLGILLIIFGGISFISAVAVLLVRPSLLPKQIEM